MGCHGDCWGAATTNTNLVGLMEPGNMGVVYSSDKWQWFTAKIAEFCRPYGGWDTSLHFFLETNPEFQYALTFLKTRICHIQTCRSSRTNMRADCDWTLVRPTLRPSWTPIPHCNKFPTRGCVSCPLLHPRALRMPRRSEDAWHP